MIVADENLGDLAFRERLVFDDDPVNLDLGECKPKDLKCFYTAQITFNFASDAKTNNAIS